ncbi:MAG: hypothetical protein P8M22_04765 [Phycisphaerales bacterium]|nr:hypothetical protein [Phycisphaerales bacterium]
MARVIKIIVVLVWVAVASPWSTAQCFNASLFDHILEPGSGPGDELGGGNMASPIVVDGDVAAIADWEQFGPEGAVVHIWRWMGSSWNFEQTLYPNLVDPNDSSYFGRVIDLDGNTLVVGDQFARVGVDNPVLTDGRIYVYEHDGQTWQFKKNLGPIDHGSNGSNGFFTSFQSLAVDGDWIFGGKTDDQCPDNNNICWNDLFIYKRVNGIWQETPHQIVEDVTPTSLLLDGNTAVWQSGCLELQGDTWVTTSNCPNVNNQYADEMRDGVALIGNTVFRRINGTWQVDASFPGSNALRLSDQQQVLESGGNIYEVWQHDGMAWSLTGESFCTGLLLLNELAFSGPHAVSGLYGTGIAVAANLSGVPGSLPPTLDPEQVIDNPTPEDYDFFGTCVAMGEDYAAIGISGESTAQTPAGSALVLKRVGNTWVQDGVLMVPVQGFSYLGKTLDVTGSGDETVIVLGGSGYCDPQGIITNPGQVFAAIRNANSSSGWGIEELVPIDPLECNAPFTVWDGFEMSVHAAGSGESTVVAAGYPGEDDGIGAVEIFRRENGAWVNVATIADSNGIPGDLVGRYLGLYQEQGGRFVLIVHKGNATFMKKYVSDDAGATWSVDYNYWTSSSSYGMHFDTLVDDQGGLVVTPDRVIRPGFDSASNNDVTLLSYASGMTNVTSLDAAMSEDSIINVTLGSNQDPNAAVKVFQLRPVSWQPSCVREIPISISLLTQQEGLGTSVAVGDVEGQPYVLAGASSADGSNNNGTTLMSGKAVMTLPAPPLAPPMPGDLDEDGRVGVNDVLLVLDHWGACEAKCGADVNLDGVVAVEDLLFVLRYWTA